MENIEKKKIIIIDDEADLAALIKDNLEQTGRFEAIAIHDALQAERICREQNPDVILMDIVMPGRKGTDIARALKDDPSTKHIPIVIMSGLGELVYRKKDKGWQWLPNRAIVFSRGEVVHERIPERAAEAYGVDYYIAKPFKTNELIRAIDEAVRRAANE